MSKLSADDKFLDFSDYGRPLANVIATQLQHTRFTPIHVTLWFGVSGLIAIFCILQGYYWAAGFFLILKSVLDAADGELARLKKTPSYTGRYLDSVFDMVLNFLIIAAICYVTKSNILIAFLAFVCLHLQGTLYNYYYVILRHVSVGGDATSKIFEHECPTAFPQETQRSVNILYKMYTICYTFFDKTIHLLDTEAYKVSGFPNWFMSALSIYGLGFQLLLIAIMLPLGFIDSVIPFFVFFTGFIAVFVALRRWVL
jgi:CDP-alcohol phosphatidyltransferase